MAGRLTVTGPDPGDEAWGRLGRRSTLRAVAATAAPLAIVVLAGAVLLGVTLTGVRWVGWGWGTWTLAAACAIRVLLDGFLRGAERPPSPAAGPPWTPSSAGTVPVPSNRGTPTDCTDGAPPSAEERT